MKIAIVGGGSYCWTPTLFRDIIFTPGLEGSEVVLDDINARHLADLHACCKAILDQTGKSKEFRVRASMDKADSLRGADYVILTITTGGYEAMANDLRIPYRYGIWQPVGDTVGPGGISRALRNIPVVVDLARRMERHCPNAWILNITNPMSSLTRAVGRETGIRCIGLCHELYGTLKRLEKILGAKNWRSDFDCVSVGVNHMPWIIRLRYKGRDAFPLLRRRLDAFSRKGRKGGKVGRAGTVLDETLIGGNQVKLALFRAFNALPAAGDRHIVEFFPFFCTEAMQKGAEMGVELTTIEERRTQFTPKWKRRVREITRGRRPIDTAVSGESTSRAIAALAGIIPEWKDVLNLPNQGQVMEMPPDVCVETMGLVTRDHATGIPVGRVPPGVLTQIQRHVTNQEMTIAAALKGDRDLALQAMINDPMTGAIGDYRNIERMLDQLLRANRRWLPKFFKG